MEKTKSQVIADFVGYVENAKKNKDPFLYAVVHSYENESMHYHDKWEWIMPVIVEIKMFQVPEEYDTPQMIRGLCNLYESILSNLATLNKENIFNSVFRFIDWYNRQVIEQQNAAERQTER